MFEGLYSYEKVLMVLGIVLFALLAGALVVFIVQKRRLGPLYPFFLLPLVMIGFPAFQKISYENGKLSMEKYVRQVADNPKDEQARVNLQASIGKIEPRAAADPKAGLMVARAFQSLNEPQRALAQVDSVLRVNPRMPQALQLRTTLSNDVLRTGSRTGPQR